MSNQIIVYIVKRIIGNSEIIEKAFIDKNKAMLFLKSLNKLHEENYNIYFTMREIEVETD